MHFRAFVITYLRNAFQQFQVMRRLMNELYAKCSGDDPVNFEKIITIGNLFTYFREKYNSMCTLFIFDLKSYKLAQLNEHKINMFAVLFQYEIHKKLRFFCSTTFQFGYHLIFLRDHSYPPTGWQPVGRFQPYQYCWERYRNQSYSID